MEYEQSLNCGYTKFYEDDNHIYLSNFHSKKNANKDVGGYVIAFSKDTHSMDSMFYIDKNMTMALNQLIA